MLCIERPHAVGRAVRQSGLLLCASGVVFTFAASLVTGCAHPAANRTWVARLDLRGVHNVSKHKLKSGLASKPTPWWKIGAPRHEFDELELARDRIRVRRFYERNGYYAIKVVLAEAKPMTGQSVDVILAVEEGAPTFIGDVKVFGIDGLDKETREKIQQYQLGLRRGQVFHHDDYLKFKSDLLAVLKKHGYNRGILEGVIDVQTGNKAIITLTFHPNGKDAAAAQPVDSAPLPPQVTPPAATPEPNAETSKDKS